MTVSNFIFGCRLRALKDLMIQTELTYKMGQRGLEEIPIYKKLL